MDIEIKKFFLYLGRWQLSTPILWVVLLVLGNSMFGTIVANLIGGCLFFFVDKRIFAERIQSAKEPCDLNEFLDVTSVEQAFNREK